MNITNQTKSYIRKPIALLISLSFIILSLNCSSQSSSSKNNTNTFYNLDFEHAMYGQGTPRIWQTYGGANAAHKVTLDSITKYQNNYSLKVNGTNAKASHFMDVQHHNFFNKVLNGKTLEVKVMIKTEDLENGFAGIGITVYYPEGKPTFQISPKENSISGTTDWTQFTITQKIEKDAKSVSLRLTTEGTGISWFDHVEIRIDGNKYQEIAPNHILQPFPKESELAWLKKHIIPLDSYDPLHNENSDLKELNSIFHQSRLVALGEVTHGSREIFMMKHRLLKYLNKEHDYNAFGIEQGFVEAAIVNEYVSGNNTDSIKASQANTWKVQSVNNLINWMKQKNSGTDPKIMYTGFDMNYWEEDLLLHLRSFKQEISPTTNTKVLSSVDSIQSMIEVIQQRMKKAPSNYFSLTSMEKNNLNLHTNLISAWISESIKDKNKAHRLKFTLRVINQALNKDKSGTRDSFMANNVTELLERSSNNKMVLWAHNGHIQNTGTAERPIMGNILKEKYGDKYLSVGFAFYEGSYSARGRKGYSAYPAQEAFPGTYEYYFNRIDTPIFLLDLRDIESNENTKFLSELEFRTTGAFHVPIEFERYNLKDNFDIIIFIKKSSNSILLD